MLKEQKELKESKVKFLANSKELRNKLAEYRNSYQEHLQEEGRSLVLNEIREKLSLELDSKEFSLKEQA